MERYRRRSELEAVHHVFNSLPRRIREALKGTHFITEYSPGYLGLVPEFNDENKRSFCRYSDGQKHLPATRRRTTVVLLDGDACDREIILHELGHALSDMFFERDPNRGLFIPLYPLTEYAKKSYGETFATSFQGWLTEHL